MTKEKSPKKRIKVKTENRKGVFIFKGNDGKHYKIGLNERKFCECFLDFKGNGAEAAFETYDCRNIRVAAAMASRLLTSVNIIAYVDKRLEETGFSDDNVKKQHLFTLNQFADLGAKNKAIDMFYKLKGEYAPEKFEISKREFGDLSNKDLAELERTLKNFLLKR